MKSKIEACVADIQAWINENKLQLSEAKMEPIVITPSRQAAKVNMETVRVRNSDTVPSNR